MLERVTSHRVFKVGRSAALWSSNSTC